ncbi:MAG: PAS-domain containing protein [Tabrizicola sp.]|uniref:PAS-domain containing protein n=1 Tax=Tabrizicola sp. TaxID=2005166 RepID=UPI002ABC60C3|nr:PAS-domain containing protein [Tabrizicola sp.]MDZ4086176.1 PAS-domain containing protein [Tabrizicola sp.]
MAVEWSMALGMMLSAFLVAMAGLVLLVAWQSRRPAPAASIFDASPSRVAYLFDGERLVDASPAGRALLPEGEDSRAWARLIARFGSDFPNLSERLEALPRTGQLRISSQAGVAPALILTAELVSGLIRLTVESGQEDRADRGDAATAAALQQEVMAQRAVLSRAPVLMWKEAADGSVIWANHAYLIRAVELLPEGEDLSWPLPKLFAQDPVKGRLPRLKLQMPSGAEWFDLVRMASGDETLCYALAADKAVQAETALREFMQTLTKTFADLPIGLAIFDRSRCLQMFNPALTDLTTLSPELLISRPTLNAFLDAMRAKAMIPEPRDYRSWRKQLARLEEEATMGLFEETWSLPGGQTYRVIGRPHPNGALAFMFEDISHEMSRTRRYRADVELGQSVIDAVEDAVAVFSQGGQLVMSNHAYAQLWQHDPQVLLSEASVSTLCAWWRDHAAPTLLWDDAVDYVTSSGDRTPWEGEVRLLDGRLVMCRFRPLTGGATLITFRVQAAVSFSSVRDTGGVGLLSA